MTKRNLGALLVAVILLGGLFWLSEPKFEASSSMGENRLFADIDPGAIDKIYLQHGENKLDLALKDGAWTVPARGGFPANASKLRGLLVKVLDLSASQSVPTNEEGIEKLGLNDKGVVEKGYAKISLSDSKGSELGGLYLGETRQKKPTGPTSPAQALTTSGQYVRRLSANQVYLVSLPVTVNAEVGYWLESSLLNILGSRVVEVEAFSGSSGAESKIYQLVAEQGSAPSGAETEAEDTRKLVLSGEIPVGYELEDSVLSQVKSGLENLSLEDVFPKDADEVKDLKTDYRLVYQVDNGLEYVVATAVKGQPEKEASGDAENKEAAATNQKIFGQISVRFNEELANRLKKEAETAWAKKQEQKKLEAEQAALKAEKDKTEAATKAEAGEETAVSPENQTAEKSDAAVEEEKMPELKLSSADEAKKLDADFQSWIYQFPSYQGSKFRRSKDQLLKKKEVEKAEAQPETATP